MARLNFPNATRAWSTLTQSREDWTSARTSGLGGSEIAGILGISKWDSPFSVWKKKVYPESVPNRESASMQWGTLLEETIRKAYRKFHPEETVEQVHAVLEMKGYPWARANLDGAVRSESGEWGILEIKTANAFSGAGDWANGVPAYYVTQADWYLLVTGFSFVRFAVLVGGSDYQEFTVKRSEERLALIWEKALDFWNRVLEARKVKETKSEAIRFAPKMEASEEDRAALSELYGVSPLVGKEFDLDADSGEDYLEARDLVGALKAAREGEKAARLARSPYDTAVKLSEEQVAIAENQVLQFVAMRDPSAQVVRLGSQTVFSMETKKGRESFKPTLLKEKSPAIYAELATAAAPTVTPKFSI